MTKRLWVSSDTAQAAAVDMIVRAHAYATACTILRGALGVAVALLLASVLIDYEKEVMLLIVSVLSVMLGTCSASLKRRQDELRSAAQALIALDQSSASHTLILPMDGTEGDHYISPSGTAYVCLGMKNGYSEWVQIGMRVGA